MGDERDLILNTCLEDVDYFIARFQTRADGPQGERFHPPLERLQNLRERLEDLQGEAAAPAPAPAAPAADPELRASLATLKGVVEQRFSRLELTVTTLLERLSALPNALESGLRDIQSDLRALTDRNEHLVGELAEVRRAQEAEAEALTTELDGRFAPLSEALAKLEAAAAQAPEPQDSGAAAEAVSALEAATATRQEALEARLTTLGAELRAELGELRATLASEDERQRAAESRLAAIAAAAEASQQRAGEGAARLDDIARSVRGLDAVLRGALHALANIPLAPPLSDDDGRVFDELELELGAPAPEDMPGALDDELGPGQTLALTARERRRLEAEERMEVGRSRGMMGGMDEGLDEGLLVEPPAPVAERPRRPSLETPLALTKPASPPARAAAAPPAAEAAPAPPEPETEDALNSPAPEGDFKFTLDDLDL